MGRTPALTSPDAPEQRHSTSKAMQACAMRLATIRVCSTSALLMATNSSAALESRSPHDVVLDADTIE
jgi:hypothetical protein